MRLAGKKTPVKSGTGEGMRRAGVTGGLMAAAFLLNTTAVLAGPWEDGMAAYNRGDYVPAIRLFRPLAEAGNPKAQSVIGAMYRKGEGVAKSSARAFMWISLAAKRGDARAKAELQEVSRDMTPTEMSQAREVMQACETSNYRNCEY
jgi:TPR repeat protein